MTGTSSEITVSDGALNYVKVETAAGGAGSEVTTQSLTAGETCTVYAAGYDAFGNYIADQSVTWTGTGVCDGNLSPTSGTSTTFTAAAAGEGDHRCRGLWISNRRRDGDDDGKRRVMPHPLP